MTSSQYLTLFYLMLMLCTFTLSLKSRNSNKVQRNVESEDNHQRKIGHYNDYCETAEYKQRCVDNGLKLDNKNFEGKTYAEISHLFSSKQPSLNLLPQKNVIYDDQNEELKKEAKHKKDDMYMNGYNDGYDEGYKKCVAVLPNSLLSDNVNAFAQVGSSQTTWLPIDWTLSPFFDITVPNQGNCGSCWAFGAAEAINSNVAIKRQKAISRLSVQELVDCVTEVIGLDGSCISGSSSYATYYAYIQGMEAFDASYPYIMKQNPNCGIYNLSASSFLNNPILSYKVYSTATDTQLYNQLKIGPIAVSIAADTPAFVQYSQGILVLNNCSSPTNHTVLLVGYGIDLATGKTFWLLKNFWGPNWGEKGYFRLEYKKYTYPCPSFYKSVTFITAAA